jgi:hypothetical protein
MPPSMTPTITATRRSTRRSTISSDHQATNPSAVSLAARAQLSAIVEAMLAPLVAQHEARTADLARQVGRLEAERDALWSRIEQMEAEQAAAMAANRVAGRAFPPVLGMVRHGRNRRSWAGFCTGCGARKGQWHPGRGSFNLHRFCSSPSSQRVWQSWFGQQTLIQRAFNGVVVQLPPCGGCSAGGFGGRWALPRAKASRPSAERRVSTCVSVRVSPAKLFPPTARLLGIGVCDGASSSRCGCGQSSLSRRPLALPAGDDAPMATNQGPRSGGSCCNDHGCCSGLVGAAVALDGGMNRVRADDDAAALAAPLEVSSRRAGAARRCRAPVMIQGNLPK